MDIPVAVIVGALITFALAFSKGIQVLYNAKRDEKAALDKAARLEREKKEEAERAEHTLGRQREYYEEEIRRHKEEFERLKHGKLITSVLGYSSKEEYRAIADHPYQPEANQRPDGTPAKSPPSNPGQVSGVPHP